MTKQRQQDAHDDGDAQVDHEAAESVRKTTSIGQRVSSSLTIDGAR
jgi:hypothetical protein